MLRSSLKLSRCKKHDDLSSNVEKEDYSLPVFRSNELRVKRDGSSASERVPVLAWLVFANCIIIMVAFHGKVMEFVSLISPSSASASEERSPYHYHPSSVEKHVLDNLNGLGLTSSTEYADTCAIVRDTRSPVYADLQNYFSELNHYNDLIKDFQPITHDLRELINANEENIEEVCSITKLHSDGLGGIFKSRLVSNSTDAGAMEPLLPTMRSHKMCNNFAKHVMSMDYLVHDFYSMCKKLKRHSKTVFVDMGASLDFHGSESQPAIYINKIYGKFGFNFDHIYAYEITKKDPSNVFELIPAELQASWHWVNVGVDSRPGSKMNPFTTITNHFSPDDFVVVKLDVDTPAVENLLARQLRDDPKLLELVDQFYFEDHVKQKELKKSWGESAEGSVAESLELMASMREKGVASHYWP
jgi:hypothetical protein|eukprot:g5181.t1 g5181   contig19:110213-111529(-)